MSNCVREAIQATTRTYRPGKYGRRVLNAKEGYPHLMMEDIRAAVAYGAASAAHQEVVLLSETPAAAKS